ncbi:YkgB protein [Paramyrothecium foliicola]|nr:YkgB protein [Paramyrothecium foliicola]
MLYWQIVTAGFAAVAYATERPTRLYVASYAGTVSTVELKSAGPNKASVLEVTYTANECAKTPSWLTLDQRKNLLYCTDRDLTSGNGTLNVFETSRKGKLTHLSRVPSIAGTVSSVAYGKNDNGLAVAAYQTSTFQTFDVSDPKAPEFLQSWSYTLEQPGPVLPNQQDPHPHQAVLDPTKKYVLVPDLGADIVRLFGVQSGSLLLNPLGSLVTLPPGTGPRHVAFHKINSKKTLLYVLGELDNTIATYELSYPRGQPLRATLLQSVSTFGEGNSAPAGTSAAEIQVTVSPQYLPRVHRIRESGLVTNIYQGDGKFVVISSRNDKKFMLPNFDPTNSTQIVSDSIVTFGINSQSGLLKLSQVHPAGGRVPRHFEVNKAGTLVAVGLQSDSRVVLIDRDAQTGELQGFRASVNIAGEIVASIFDE